MKDKTTLDKARFRVDASKAVQDSYNAAMVSASKAVQDSYNAAMVSASKALYGHKTEKLKKQKKQIEAMK